VSTPARIVLFGESLVDAFPSGPVVGGAPLNVARHLAAFGHAPLMLSAIGDDAHGERVRREFERFGLAIDGLQRLPALPTGVVHVDTGSDGTHAFRIGAPAAYDAIGSAAIDALRRHAQRTTWLYHGTLALRGGVSRSTWRGLMGAHVGPVYLDLNWRAGHVEPEVVLEACALADVLKVNDDELALLAAWLDLPADKAATSLLRRFALRLLVVTRGARGYEAFGADGECVARGSAIDVPDLADTVGAGDAFSAVLLAGLAEGRAPAPTLERANRFAARVGTLRGAVPQDLAWYGAAA
jgi:fructokinase